MVTHDPVFAQAADRRIFIVDGRLEQPGKAAEHFEAAAARKSPTCGTTASILECSSTLRFDRREGRPRERLVLRVHDHEPGRVRQPLG